MNYKAVIILAKILEFLDCAGAEKHRFFKLLKEQQS